MNLPTSVAIVLVGCMATAVLDLWSYLQRRCGIATLDYALVGRWLGHLPRGRFSHASIRASTSIAGERGLGWAAHYLIGIAFAGLLVAWVGAGWLQAPSWAPALVFGIASVAAPFFVLQPALGLGVAAARTPKPNQARLRSLMSHAVFGLGLYAAAWALQVL
ncbi:MAG: hypothetical protein GAK45_00002 [Pseudomonas citronellolis]|nr:MAG: hypothetical protein GAK45_00002 [Pseudomonas citronellolis]